MPTDPHRALAVFLSVLDHPDPAGRAAALDRACGADPALRDQVQALLDDHRAEPATLDPAAVPFAATGEYRPAGPSPTSAAAPSPALGPGTVLSGRYTLRQLLGEGGMGQVWAADQTEPVQRPVAVKLVKAGMDSRAVLARFEAERQALALMDHPHVAKVLDGGLTDGGAPFFVMELVPGQPLTAFADGARLTVRERLELFVRVCQAVQHAHQKGLIHRDLKPGNVLVTAADGPPAPKVIDFGLAKATDGRLAGQGTMTQAGAVVGTLEYMAPEQTGYGALDIDTRADVYALGVILYDLLTGLRPIDEQRAAQATVWELLRIIQEEEPPRPSARLAAAPDLAALAAARRAEPAALLGQLRGDLDWVVMKCLEKDRGRRYDSAAALARDVERHLADEPVEARPPSAWYRGRKFVRRHRLPVAAAALALLALVGGVVAASWGLVEARRQEALAEARRVEAEAARHEAAARAEAEAGLRRKAQDAEQKATTAAAEAQRQWEEAEISRRFLLWDVFAKAASADQIKDGFAPNPNLTVREALDRADRNIRQRSLGKPMLEARIRTELAEIYVRLGDSAKALTQYRQAIALREKELGPENPATLITLTNFARALQAAGQPGEAIAVFERVLAAHRKADPGAEISPTLLNNLALAYRDAGRGQEALALLEALYARHQRAAGPDHQGLQAARYNLALVCRDAGQRDRALALFREFRDQAVTDHGRNHPTAFWAIQTYAAELLRNGRPAAAADELEAVRDAVLSAQAIEPGVRYRILGDLAEAYAALGRPERIGVLEQLRDLQVAARGPDHPDSLASQGRLAEAYAQAGRAAEADRLWDATAAAARARLGPGHPVTGQIEGGRIVAAERTGDWAKAAALRRDRLAVERTLYRAGAVELAGSMAALGCALLQAGQPAEAEAVLRECLAIRAKAQPDAWWTFNTHALIGRALLAQGKHAEAEPLLVAGFRGMAAREARDPPPPSRLIEAAAALARLYEATDRPQAAAPYRAEEARRLAAELARDLAWPLLWGWPR